MKKDRRRILAGISAWAAAIAIAPVGVLTACADSSMENDTRSLKRGTSKRDVSATTITVHADRPLRRVNPLILGNNIDWTHSAHAFYEENTQRVSSGFMALADRLAPTALRYPGGTNSDFYHWQNGIGPFKQRQPNKTMDGSKDVIGLGTDEYLALCKRWDSEPLITVNLATGTANEAAEWVRYVNKRTTDLPRVKYWEIGNEPYLKAHFPESGMTPAEYARRANAFIRAMKVVDPTIQVGLTLRNDTLGGVEATPFKGFNDIVLKGVSEPFEFAALHSSYFPVTFEKKESEEELFLATMAGTRSMQEDMETTRTLLRRYHPKRQIRLAITEFNALYSMDILRFGLASVFLSKTDRYIESMAGALYVADALRVLSQTDDLLMANYWSLTGNWWFGAIGHDGKPRPQFHVLEAYRDLIHGDLLETDVNGPVMATPRAGFVPSRNDIQVVGAHAVSDKGIIRIAVINRHPNQPAHVRLSFPRIARGDVEVRDLTSDHYFAKPVSWSTRRLALREGGLEMQLPRHAFSVITLRPS